MKNPFRDGLPWWAYPIMFVLGPLISTVALIVIPPAIVCWGILCAFIHVGRAIDRAGDKAAQWLDKR